MKKSNLILILCAVIVAAGLLVKSYSKALCMCMVLGGLIVFLGTLGAMVLIQANRCPSCGQRIYVRLGQHNRVRGGMIPCPKCEVLVRVDHVTPR